METNVVRRRLDPKIQFGMPEAKALYERLKRENDSILKEAIFTDGREFRKSDGLFVRLKNFLRGRSFEDGVLQSGD